VEARRRLSLADIAAGLEVEMCGYRVTDERAQQTSKKYGAHSISLLALKPIPNTITN
jgi:hypothetical protein